MSDQSNSMYDVINFGAGPAKLPQQVLKDVQKELLAYGNTQMSILELSHRSNEIKNVIDNAQATLRDLLNIPDNYKILFMQGGGAGLFAAIPLNMMTNRKADYILTGLWSAKAAAEAAKYGTARLIMYENYTKIPDPSTWNLDPQASYVYYCANETINGVEFNYIPETKGVPLVADMSSNILTRSLDISKFAVIFAGAQKNIGPAGVTLVIVRDDVLGHPSDHCPSVFNFTLMAANNSLYNTPPVFQIYTVGLVLKWVKEHNGVEAMEKLAIEKSRKLYDVIDQSEDFYSCPIDVDARSRVNVVFKILEDNKSAEQYFLSGAKARGMMQLGGHRFVGGLRASLYNAITLEETQKLVDYMQWFRQEYLKEHK
ncbi:phosphoserine aminotransferase [Colletes gigas]|uniref:phosphoserine aminotransferase n=1 Tax=Colletes gigas TaxID=935657 RepID=UPI001C9B30E2|nr:phosphoserine aminotransferase [Colletes gigas]